MAAGKAGAAPITTFSVVPPTWIEIEPESKVLELVTGVSVPVEAVVPLPAVPV